MKYDINSHDARVVLTCERRHGVWAASLATSTKKTIRIGGNLSGGASSHSLLAVALGSILRTLTTKEAAMIAESARAPKPRIMVVTSDEGFADALTALLNRQHDKNAHRPLRAGRNFLSQLAKQLARFSVTFQHVSPDSDDRSVRVLRGWAHSTIHAPREISRLSQALLPTVVSDMG